MNDYTEARFEFTPCNPDITDLAAAYLADAGFESFVPDEAGLTAYIRTDAGFTAEMADNIFLDFPFDVNIRVDTATIEGKDWNHEWEKNYFKPIVIDNTCVIHSSFHTDVPSCIYDIVIDPKMAFGTGHHATTSLMMRRLLAELPDGKTVVDMGTGTGILAILSSMLGAKEVVGIEIDETAWLNAIDNLKLNGCSDVRLINGDASALAALPEESADIFLANINRNIVVADMDAYVRVIKTGGELILSGFYVDDVDMVRSRGESLGLHYVDFMESDRWVSVMFRK